MQVTGKLRLKSCEWQQVGEYSLLRAEINCMQRHQSVSDSTELRKRG